MQFAIKSLELRHHSLPCLPTAYIHIAVIGVTLKSMASTLQFSIHFVEQHIRQQRREHASHNVAKLPLEITVSLSRRQVQPAYGDGFGGAPLEPVKFDSMRTPSRGGDGGRGKAESTDDIRTEPRGRKVPDRRVCTSRSRATTTRRKPRGLDGVGNTGSKGSDRRRS